MTKPTHSENSALQNALTEAHNRFIKNNPKSHQQHKDASQYLPGGNTRTVLFSAPFPITLKSSTSCYVTSIDDKQYIDYLGEFTAGLYGHSNELIKNKIQDILDKGWVRGGHIEEEAQLAKQLCQRFPSIELIRFTNSGTEANLYALSVCQVIKQKKKIMVFEGAYHGGVLTFGSSPNPLNVPFEFIVAPYNDWDKTEQLLDQYKNDLACVLLEPMQGSGGCIPATYSFLKNLRDWTQQQDVILIFDEVMTSRMTGGGLQKKYDLIPDMTTLGKYLGGGFSFGAFGGKAEIMDRLNPLHPQCLNHAGTFNNNIFTMAAGAVALEKVFTPEAALNLSAKGEALRKKLNQLAEQAPFPMQFTGIGSLMNVHMCSGSIQSIRDTQNNNNLLRELFYFDMLEQGIWPARRGMLNLSLPMGEKEFNQLLLAVDSFIDQRKGIAI